MSKIIHILIPSSRVVLTAHPESESSEVWSIQTGYTTPPICLHTVKILRGWENVTFSVVRLFSDWLNEIPGHAQLGPRV